MTYPEPVLELARRLIALCTDRGLTLATAESCTGGLIIGALTSVPGSSAVVERGFVTYSNAAKTAMLGVAESLIEHEGAVSEPVARAMAEGALDHAPVDLAVAVTGIAGPGGGSADKPVGLVHMAAARRGKETVHRRSIFAGDRETVRLATVIEALGLLTEIIE